MSNEQKELTPNYTADIQDVFAAEKEYLGKRHKVNEITEEEAAETWGICFSSGGVRAGIISLGIIQQLSKRNFFRRFDYMSTVSGGGFIAGCLTSLLTGAKSVFGKFGVQPENSPFLANSVGEGDIDPAHPTPAMQLEHLKKARGFLPEISLTGLSFNSLLGVWMGGWLFSLFVYLSVLFFGAVSSVAFLDWVSEGVFKGDIQAYYIGLDEKQTFLERIDVLFSEMLWIFGSVLGDINSKAISILIFFGLAGFLYSVAYAEHLRFDLKPNSHRSIIVKRAKRYILIGLFYMYTIIFAGGFIRGLKFKEFSFFSEFGYWLVFLFPLVIAVGMTLGTHVMSIIYHSLQLKSKNIDDLKFAISGIKGSNLLILLVSIGTPFVILTSFWIGGITAVGLAFVLFVLGAYWTLIKSKVALRPSAGSNLVFRWGSNFLAALIIYFSFAGLIRLLVYLLESNAMIIKQSFFVSIGVMLLLFFFSQGNRSNLHNFLKLKLAAAILTTERKLDNNQLVNLRNDRGLKLHEIGDDNFSGPYHIINASVNVHQSDEQYLRERKAIPFFFTKYFVGSEATNYVKTETYQNGNTRLVDALANSTAFIHSGMGIYNFWAQSFLITSLNLRLGAWIHNPLYYQKGILKSRVNHAFRNIIKEFIGRFDERSRYINVSDGIHTGDNFGLIPLLVRECSHIVLCDFTTDKEYLSFMDRFEQTIQIAQHYKVKKIEIDPAAFRPEGDMADSGLCKSCVQIGTIEYKSGKTGTIYYLKSLLSEQAPVELKSYFENDANFPFESLTKQNFEPNKFEMYRSLGEHVAEEFLRRLDSVDENPDNTKDPIVLDDKHNELFSYIDELMARLDKENVVKFDIRTNPDLNSREDVEAYFEEIKGRLEQIVKRMELEKTFEQEGLLKSKMLLLEKKNYLLKVKAKLADGSEKFEILKTLEETEKELNEIEESINKLSNK